MNCLIFSIHCRRELYGVKFAAYIITSVGTTKGQGIVKDVALVVATCLLQSYFLEDFKVNYGVPNTALLPIYLICQYLIQYMKEFLHLDTI